MADYYVDPSSIVDNPRMRRALARIERMPPEQKSFMINNILASGAGDQMQRYLQMIGLKSRIRTAEKGMEISRRGMEQRGEMSRSRMEQTKGINLAELALREKLGNARLDQERYLNDLVTGYEREQEKKRFPWEVAGLGVSALGALQQWRNTEEEKRINKEILKKFGVS